MNPELRQQRCAAQHFGAWLIKPDWFSEAVGMVKDGTWVAKPAPDTDEDESQPYAYLGWGVARVDVRGSLTKTRSSFGGSSSLDIRRGIRAAQESKRVKSLMLVIDSPGGRTDVPAAVVDDIRAFQATGRKVYSFVEGLCCSAAYWIASVTDKIYAGRSDMIGSIGVFAVLTDTSGMQERMGVKSITVSTGRYKGLHADGKVTPDAIASVQEEIDAIMEQFQAEVKAGRNMADDQLTSVSDGRVFIGHKAQALGLVDTITTYDAALQEIQAMSAMNHDEFKAFAATNPNAVKDLDAVKSYAASEYARGKADAVAEAKAEADKGKLPDDVAATLKEANDTRFDSLAAKGAITPACATKLKEALASDVSLMRSAEGKPSFAGRLAEALADNKAVPLGEETGVQTLANTKADAPGDENPILAEINRRQQK